MEATHVDQAPDLLISGLRIRAVAVVPDRPVQTAAGVMASTPLVLIDLQTREGVVGCSYVRCYTPLALAATAQLLEDLGDIVVGVPLDPDAVQATLQAGFRLLGLQGLVTIAIAGVEMAAWDAKAKALGVPLTKLLGGEPRPIPAYASLRTMAPGAAAEEAGEAVARGFGGVKLKLGGGTLADDLDAIRAVRGAIGQRTELMVDYNQSLSVDEAIHRVRALDAKALTWIEEPTRADDYAGHARIAARARTPIALGENWWGPHDMEKSIAARRVRLRDARRDEARRGTRLADRGIARRKRRPPRLEPHVPGAQRPVAGPHPHRSPARISRPRRRDPDRADPSRGRPRVSA